MLKKNRWKESVCTLSWTLLNEYSSGRSEMKLGSTDLEDKKEEEKREISVVRISSVEMTKGC